MDTDTLGVAIPAFERERAEVRVVDAWNPDTEWDGMWKGRRAGSSSSVAR
jgi:hypothetical protein